MFIYNNTDILNPDDMNLRPMNGYGIKPYGPRTGLRVLSGLGSYIDNVIRDTGGLQPGQRITFEQAKYLYTGGQSKANPEQYAYMTPESFNSSMNPFGSLNTFLDTYQATLLRLTAQKAADDAYAAYTAARVNAAPAAAALLEFDANGRATDESVAAAIEYQNATAPGVSQAADRLEQAQANVQAVAQVITQQQSAAAAAAAAAVPKTYTDAELAGIIQTKLIDQAMTPGAIESELVTRYGVERSRATALVNAEFAALQTEYIAAQTAKREAEQAQALQAQQAALNAEQARNAKAAAEFAAQQAAAARAELAKVQADAKAALDELIKAKDKTPTVTPLPGDITKLPVITTTPTTPAAGGLGPLLLAVAAAYVLGA
jgi:hypothetical protein